MLWLEWMNQARESRMEMMLNQMMVNRTPKNKARINNLPGSCPLARQIKPQGCSR